MQEPGVDGSECRINNDPVDRPDVELITTEETFGEILAGKYSPVEAFLDGKMRFRGNADMGERILENLGTGIGRTRC